MSCIVCWQLGEGGGGAGVEEWWGGRGGKLDRDPLLDLRILPSALELPVGHVWLTYQTLKTAGPAVYKNTIIVAGVLAAATSQTAHCISYCTAACGCHLTFTPYRGLSWVCCPIAELGNAAVVGV